MPLETADKTVIGTAGQASPWFGWCWTLDIIHFWVLIFEDSGWLTLGSQMKCIWSESVVLKLHFNCHNLCTIGYWTRSRYEGADRIYILLFVLCILENLSFYLLCHPYVSMGIVAQRVNYRQSEQWQVKQFMVDYNHWKVQTSTSMSFCTIKSMDSLFMTSFCTL